MKNIHILPTDKPSRVFITNAKSIADNLEVKINIYITSDEEIKDGDWFLLLSEEIVLKSDNNSLKNRQDLVKKIILTTDQDLIKDGVQAIDDEFLEWFVKNPSCEEVEVTYGVLKPFQSEDKGYLIHCPDNEVLEEPKQETLEEVGMYQQELFNYLHDLGVTALQSEMQEIERIVLGMQNINALHFEIDALKREIKVFKHQQEQDKNKFSEEDLHNAFYNGWLYRGEDYQFPKAKKEWLNNLKTNKI